MDSGSRQILETLSQRGFEAYYVGGCVRDYLMGIEPNDIDICTNARPADIMNSFERTLPTGVEYGTITVRIADKSYEVTTFRAESDYDGRRPKVIRFSDRLHEDLSRRDFTINAMAMTLNGELIDPFDGRRDLKLGCLRFVGNPVERLREDKLRLFRYVRFLTRFQFQSAHEADEQQWQLDLSQLSFERIQQELNLMLLSEVPSQAIRHLHRLGALAQIFPEILPAIGFEQRHPAHFEDVFEHTLSVLDACPPQLEVRLAALCHDLGKPHTFSVDDKGCGHFYGHQKQSVLLAETFLSRLKYSNAIKAAVLMLTAEHMRMYNNGTKPMARRLIRLVGQAYLEQLFSLQLADTTVCSGDRSAFVEAIQQMKALCEMVSQEESAFGLKDLAISGNDLLALGLEGKAIGTMLNRLLEAVTDEQLNNQKDELLTYVHTAINEQNGEVEK